MENCLIVEQAMTIDKLRERIEELELSKRIEEEEDREKDKELKELRQENETLRVERDTWQERFKQMKKLKNDVRTDKFVHRQLDEWDFKVHRTGIYDALKWDYMENTPGKRVKFTEFGKRREEGVPLKDNIVEPPKKTKRVEEDPPNPPVENVNTVGKIHSLLDKYLSNPSSLSVKKRRKEKRDPSSYNTEGGFLTPDDKKLFLQLEGELSESDSAPIVDVFKIVLQKLRGVTGEK